MRKGEHSREVKTTVVFVIIKRKWFSNLQRDPIDKEKEREKRGQRKRGYR